MSIPLLAVDTGSSILYLANHDESTDYAVRELALPAPRKRDAVEMAMRWGAKVAGPWETLAERTITLDCLGATEAAAEAALIALQNALDTHGAKLLWQSESGNPLIYTTIRAAEVSEPSVLKLKRSAGKLRVSLTLVTDDVWTDTAGIDFAPDAFAMPASADVTVAKGDRPARLRLKATSASANTVFGFGIKRDPRAGYDAVDAYTPEAANLTGSYAALDTAPNIDTNDNRGRHVPVALVTTSADPVTDTRYRAKVTTSGSGVSRSSAEESFSVAAAIAGATPAWQVLPEIAVPAGGVPDITTGSGFAAESDLVAQRTGAGTVTLTPGGGVMPYQSITLTAGWKVTGCVLKGYKSLPYLHHIDVTLVDDQQYTWTTAMIVGASLPLSAEEFAFSFDFPRVVPAGTYRLYIEPVGGNFTLTANTSNPYAGGAWSAAAGTDIFFALRGQTPLGFNTTTAVEGKGTGGDTATLSTLVRLPSDDCCLVVSESFSADHGFIVENVDPLTSTAVYYTTSTAGTAGDAISPVVRRGQARLHPGVNRLVFAGTGNVTVTGTYWPCYSHAAAGAL